LWRCKKTFALGEKSWVVNALTLDLATYDLSVKNPNAPEEAPLRDPAQIIEDMLERDAETAGILETIRGML
jgi:type I restriction enzyme M protein